MTNPEIVRGTCRGRVQGVFFRASMQQQAERLGVRGWVRNEPDGSVAFLAAGLPDAVQALIDWAGQGPPSARVDAVDVEPASEAPAGEGFEVRG